MTKVSFCLVLVAFVGVTMYQQNDYIIVLERIEVPSYNKNHISFAEAHNSKYNRTHFCTNFTAGFKTNFGRRLKLKIQAYKFASNEYRLFPITFEVNLCNIIEKNDFGVQNIYNCGNFPRCPMKKGNWVLCNWGPDFTKFPPYVPRGSYMMHIKGVYDSTVVFEIQAYGIVKDIPYIPN